MTLPQIAKNEKGKKSNSFLSAFLGAPWQRLQLFSGWLPQSCGHTDGCCILVLFFDADRINLGRGGGLAD
ncbi:hypothetical protein IF2G_01605 [Cordyceps javanica]|nr:hypothetical protein IF2G_01605 [Cordyceps javanica]